MSLVRSLRVRYYELRQANCPMGAKLAAEQSLEVQAKEWLHLSGLKQHF